MEELSDTTALVTQAPPVGKAVRKRIQHLQKNGSFCENRNAFTVLREPLVLHGLPTRRTFFVDSSTADVIVRVGPG